MIQHINYPLLGKQKVRIQMNGHTDGEQHKPMGVMVSNMKMAQQIGLHL
jgi:hypothetical protein